MVIIVAIVLQIYMQMEHVLVCITVWVRISFNNKHLHNLDNSSNCVGNTCTIGNYTICLDGTVNINGSCRRKYSWIVEKYWWISSCIVAWCESTCSGFCDLEGDSYECNCSKHPGYQRSTDGKSCRRKKELFG